MNTASRHTVCLFAGLISLGLNACKDQQPITYQIPKEAREVSMPGLPADHPPTDGQARSTSADTMQVLPGMQEAAAAAPDIQFTIPEYWSDAGATGMRKANLKVTDDNGSAEITALTFPGDVGGRLANINRWRGQIGLEAVTSDDLPAFTQGYTISGHHGLYIRMEGEQKSLLGAILPFHGDTWFFKMIGDTPTVLAQESAMKAFIDSVRIEDTHH